jgi:PEP-CTERM motif
MRPSALTIRMFVPSLIVLFALGILAGRAHATSVGVSITSDTTDLILTEGDSGTITFTVHNDSGYSIAFPDIATIFTGATTGDGTDVPVPFSTTPFDTNVLGSCGGGISDGSTCTYTLNVDTDQDVGEIDANSGTTQYTISQGWHVPGGSDSGTAMEDFSITVNDPSVAAPEPPSLLLLGIGLLGVLALAAGGRRVAASVVS